MRRLTLAATLIITAVSLFATSQAHAATEPFVGEISIFAGTFAPRGWMFCEGQELKIAEHTALFSLLGTTYGGDGRTTFKLPDLRKAEVRLREDAGLEKDAKGPRYIIAIFGVYPSRN